MECVPARLSSGLFAGLLLACMAGTALAAGGVERVWRQVATLAMAPIPSLAVLRQRCGDDALCAGRMLAEALGRRAGLERKVHPDTDVIRLVKVHASVCGARRLPNGAIHLRLDRFGLKAVRELRRALRELNETADDVATMHVPALVLDLRRNNGGDLKRMLRVAALFGGPLTNAIRLRTAQGVRRLDIPAPRWRVNAGRIDILVGPDTTSSAELFAALLRRHVGARLLGARTYGKDWLLTPVALTHDWRLLVPSAIAEVPGQKLRGGLTPDAPLPAMFAARKMATDGHGC